MLYPAYIFDLDGTLLNTLGDLVRLTNKVLDNFGWPARSRDEILNYVGNGGRALLAKAVPAGVEDEEIDRAFKYWQELYPEYGHAFTVPYDGIPEMLAQLKAGGAKLGVLSNKFDGAVQDVIAHHFPGLFDAVRGEGPDTPRKPDPTGLRRMAADLGVKCNEIIYVGDSPSDMETALNAGAYPVGVSWGYRSVESLASAKAGCVIDAPHDLLDIVVG